MARWRVCCAWWIVCVCGCMDWRGDTAERGNVSRVVDVAPVVSVNKAGGDIISKMEVHHEPVASDRVGVLSVVLWGIGGIGGIVGGAYLVRRHARLKSNCSSCG